MTHGRMRGPATREPHKLAAMLWNGVETGERGFAGMESPRY